MITGSTRPAYGRTGAIAAGHPDAARAGTDVLARGGSAMDAAIAAQAVICVAMPQAAGLGGDMLALIRTEDRILAVNGTGLSSAEAPDRYTSDGGASVTVPGLVDGWLVAHEAFGRLPLESILEPAVRLAESGFPVDRTLSRAVAAQAERLERHGAGRWSLLGASEGRSWSQPELAATLRGIGAKGRAAFYEGAAGAAIADAVRSQGGALSPDDLRRHRTAVGAPVTTTWDGGLLAVQPPSSQGVLLAMAASYLEACAPPRSDLLPHLLVEATEGAFAYRDRVAEGARLLDRPLEVDPERAGLRGGPRAYLHTAGVAAADSEGMVVSSLISVFDDFGSAVYVPELGIVLNNRAGGFTAGANASGPSKRPVHTLAPAMIVRADGTVLALATPGADGLRARGHRVCAIPAGDDLFGAVVAAGIADGRPFAASDWRRLVTTGAI